MSSSIAIPKRRGARRTDYGGSSEASSSSSTSAQSIPSSAASSYATSPRVRSSDTTSTSSMARPISSSHGSFSVSSSPIMSSSSGKRGNAERRPSLLGTSLSRSEYTVVNIAGPDGPPRLVTCVKSSQGFDWNQDIFLPSYIDYDSSDLEHKPDPVDEITLTDEEAAALLPQ